MDAERIAQLKGWVKYAGDVYDDPRYPDADREARADLLALLEEAQIKAGDGPRIFPRVDNDATLGGPSPGLSDADERERVRSLLEDVCGDCIHEGRPLVSDGVIDSILAPPKPTVTRTQIKNIAWGILSYLNLSRKAELVSAITDSELVPGLRDLGITVGEEK